MFKKESKQTQELFNLIKMASNSEMNLLLVKMLECKKFDKVDDVSRVKVVIEIILKLNNIF